MRNARAGWILLYVSDRVLRITVDVLGLIGAVDLMMGSQGPFGPARAEPRRQP
jgi:hypothetical protein